MVKHLEKEEDFEKLVSEGLVLVDFYADWCGPCKMLGPVLEELDANVVKLNVDTFPDLASRYGVMSIPTIIYFKDGKEVKKTIGFLNKSELEDTISSL